MKGKSVTWVLIFLVEFEIQFDFSRLRLAEQTQEHLGGVERREEGAGREAKGAGQTREEAGRRREDLWRTGRCAGSVTSDLFFEIKIGISRWD